VLLVSIVVGGLIAGELRRLHVDLTVSDHFLELPRNDAGPFLSLIN
jgi:hypothetical protein